MQRSDTRKHGEIAYEHIYMHMAFKAEAKEVTTGRRIICIRIYVFTIYRYTKPQYHISNISLRVTEILWVCHKDD